MACMNTPLLLPPFADEIRRCRAAQVSWAALPIRQRLRPVKALRHLFVEAADALTQAVEQDLGRPADEVLGSDIIPTADACRFLEKNAARLLRPVRVPRPQRPLWLWGARDTVYRRPHGVVGIIGTWNYPVFLNGVQIVQALTAGNGVLWKPSELVPRTAGVLHELFLKAGLPADLFLRLPATREAGPQVAEADVDYVVFTGSAEVGRKLARRLGERLVPSTLELSGCDAMFVLADANAELAATAAWFGAVFNKGQTCLAVRRAFVHRSRYADFLERLRPLAEGVKALPLALRSQSEQAERLVREAVEQGAHVLAGGEKFPSEGAEFPPTVVADARPEMAICREASFAPLLAVLPFDSVEEALEMNAACVYGLGASVFTADLGRAETIAERLGVGSVTVNDVIAPTAHPATPFGGRGDSGWGVTQGAEGLLAMTAPQAVTVRSGTFRPHFDGALGLDPATAELLRGLLAWSHGARFGQRLRGLWRMIRGGMNAKPRPEET